MKRFYYLVILLLSAALMYAEMVLLYPSANVKAEKVEMIDAECLEALQNGIMTVFFNSDLIIFNTSLVPDETDTGMFHEKAMRMAKLGGATHLIETSIIYEMSSAGKSFCLPSDVHYVLTDCKTDELIVNGTIKPADMGFNLQGDPKNLAFSLGQMIGMRVLGNMAD